MAGASQWAKNEATRADLAMAHRLRSATATKEGSLMKVWVYKLLIPQKRIKIVDERHKIRTYPCETFRTLRRYVRALQALQ